MNIPKAILFTVLLYAIEVIAFLGFAVLLDPIMKDRLSGDDLIHYYRIYGEVPFVLAYLVIFLLFFKSDFEWKKGVANLRGLNIRILGYVVILAIGMEFLDRPFFDFSKIVDSLKGGEVIPYSSRHFSIYRIISMVLLGPIFEELFYRKIIFARLLEKHSLNVSILVSSICFALVHLPSYKNLLPTFIFGIISCLIYYKTRNIFYSIILHVLANLNVVLLSLYGEGFYEWIFSLKFNMLYWLVFLTGVAITLFGVKKITATEVHNKR